MTSFTRLIRFALPAVLLFGCGGKDDEPSPADNMRDRQVILTHWADDIIIPAYEDFAKVFSTMETSAEAFTAVPDEASLATFRSAWVDAYTAWQKIDLFEFGPADKYTLRNFFNIYPADVRGILANIDDPSANLDLPSAYARQGFPALDYLLNGVGDNDADIVAFYLAPEDGAARLAYLSRIVSRMRSLLDNVITEWKTKYRDTFIASTGLDIGSSTGLVVNAYTLYYERFVRSGKIGIPSGAALGGGDAAYPEGVEAFYKKDISRSLAKTAHQAAADFFNGRAAGADGPSLKSYLDGLGAKDQASGTLLSTIINDQFEAVETQLDQLSPNFYEQITADNGKMIDTFAAMQKLVRLLKVDMTSAMSITITYTDNDGD